MTEIPEHLLKRSRERRSAIGQGGEDGATPAADAPAAATPATTAAAPAAAAPTGPAARAAAKQPAAAPPPPPDPHYVKAAKQRRKIPFWAMATLSLMPVWGFMYYRALVPSEEVAEGPLGLGAEVYNSCASCHGAGGGGGVGYAFAGGEVLKTFPNIEDQVRYVYFGTAEYNLAGVGIYGDPNREGGAHVSGELGMMPQFGESAGGNLTDYRVVAVVCHERYTLGGADPTSEEWAEEYEHWCSEESPIFNGLQGGLYDLATLHDNAVDLAGDPIEMIPVGDAPAEGSGR